MPLIADLAGHCLWQTGRHGQKRKADRWKTETKNAFDGAGDQEGSGNGEDGETRDQAALWSLVSPALPPDRPSNSALDSSVMVGTVLIAAPFS